KGIVLAGNAIDLVLSVARVAQIGRPLRADRQHRAAGEPRRLAVAALRDVLDFGICFRTAIPSSRLALAMKCCGSAFCRSFFPG
ncbi:hypothetical protein ACQWF0_24970, partial [Salmonella enterica subsp. enterica serovar Infantis]